MSPHRQERERWVTESVAWLSNHPQVLAAARYAHEFHVDVVDVLRDSGDEFLMMVRGAALRVVQRDEEEKERQAKSRRGRR